MKTLYLCTGSDCRKPKKKILQLLLAVEEQCTIQPVGCQKICDAPVVGVEVDGTVEWFGPIDSDKSRAGLVTLLTEGRLKKPLKKRHARKRSGQLRSP